MLLRTHKRICWEIKCVLKLLPDRWKSKLCLRLVIVFNYYLCSLVCYLHWVEKWWGYLHDLKLLKGFILHFLEKEPTEKVEVTEPLQTPDCYFQRIWQFDYSLEVEIGILIQQHIQCHQLKLSHHVLFESLFLLILFYQTSFSTGNYSLGY